MKSKKWYAVFVATALAVAWACGDGFTGTPSYGQVTSRQVQKNMPGGSGKDHILINICVKASDGSTGCDNYPPDQVDQCKVRSKWPDCKG